MYQTRHQKLIKLLAALRNEPMTERHVIVARCMKGRERTMAWSNKQHHSMAAMSVSVAQNFRLVWLDTDRNGEGNDDLRLSLFPLKRIVSTIDTFSDAHSCADFLHHLHDDQVLMILSSPLEEDDIHLMHEIPSLNSIFVFSPGSKSLHLNSWAKVKGVFDDVASLHRALQQAVRQCEQDAIQISIVTADETTTKDLEHIEPSFMYTQLLKEVLLEIDDDDSDGRAIEELIVFARQLYANNASELEKIDQLEREYHEHSPIWWYTYECFLYPMLNRSLRLLDVERILKMGFFIRHLHRQIEQLHREQVSEHDNPLIVYRGQGFSKENFDKLLRSKGGLLSFNNFLSTSKSKKVSLNFARSAPRTGDSLAILFVMSIDRAVATSPFALLNNVSYYSDIEQEILFSMNTLFRIDQIEEIDATHRIWQVQLILTADTDPQLSALSTRLREETQGVSGWQRLALLLIKLGQNVKAEQLYRALLDQTSEEVYKAYYEHQLGCIQYKQGEYAKAILSFTNALEIRLRTLPSDHPHLATSYNSIGGAHYSNGDWSKALRFYEQALDIRQRSLPAHHPSLATTYNNIAILSSQMGEHAKALSYYEKMLDIEERTLPPLHPDLATSYNNIGGLYNDMTDYAKALSLYHKALEIRRKALPAGHPDLPESLDNIGSAYRSLAEYSNALASHDEALAMRQTILPPNHPDLANSHSNIGLLYDKMGDYDKALSSHHKALKIRQQSLPPAHFSTATSHNNIGVVYFKARKYDKALAAFEHAVEIGQVSLPSGHPDLELFRQSLASARKMILLMR